MKNILTWSVLSISPPRERGYEQIIQVNDALKRRTVKPPLVAPLPLLTRHFRYLLLGAQLRVPKRSPSPSHLLQSGFRLGLLSTTTTWLLWDLLMDVTPGTSILSEVRTP